MNVETLGDWYDADGNADAVRLWEEDGTLLAVLTNDYDCDTHPYVTYAVTASDTFRIEWQEECSGYRRWQDALRALFAHEVPAARDELERILP